MYLSKNKRIIAVAVLALTCAVPTISSPSQSLRLNALGPINGDYKLSYVASVFTHDGVELGADLNDWRYGLVSNMLSPNNVKYTTNFGMHAGYQKKVFTPSWHVYANIEAGYHVTMLTHVVSQDSARVDGLYVQPQIGLMRKFMIGKSFLIVPSVGLVWKYNTAEFENLVESESVTHDDNGFSMSKEELNDRYNGVGLQIRLDCGYAFY